MSTTKKRAAKSKPEAKPKPKPKAPETEAGVVRAIRKRVEAKLQRGVAKASLADYIRLVQLEKELQNTEAKETRATWVNPKQTEVTEESNAEK